MALPQELIDEAKALGVETTFPARVPVEGFETARGLINQLEGALRANGLDDAPVYLESGYENAELFITVREEWSESCLKRFVGQARKDQEKARKLRQKQYEALKKEFESEG